MYAQPPQAQPAGAPFGQPPNAAVPNCFPRMYIGAGETIIYETRPSLVPYILGSIIYLVIGLLIIGSVATDGLTAGDWGILIFLFVILPVIGLLLGYLRWMRTAFAITDKRALRSSGIFSRNTNDCGHSKIQNVTLRQGVFDRIFGYGHIIFATAGVQATREADVLRAGGVYWMGVKDPINTRRFVQEVQEYLSRQQKIQEYQDMARVLQASGATMAPGAAPPPPAPPAGAPGAPTCTGCGRPTAWIAQYSRWYCASCQRYV